jgi:O-antigen ligase
MGAEVDMTSVNELSQATRETPLSSCGIYSVLINRAMSFPWTTLLLVFLAPLLGVFVGYGISREDYLIVGIIVAIIPVGLFLLRRPFDMLIIWLLISPCFVITVTRTARLIYWVTHRAMIPLTTVVILISLLVQKRLRFDWIDLSILAYLLLNIFSIFYHYPNHPLPEIYEVYDTVVIGATLFWLLRMIRPDEAQLKRLAFASIFVVLFHAGISVMQNIPGAHTILPDAWMAMKLRSGRSPGVFKGVPDLGATLITLLLIAAHYAFHTRRALPRLLCAIAAVLATVSLLLGFSRATWLGSAFVAVLLYLSYPRVRPYILLTALIIALVLSANVFAHFSDFALERLQQQNTVDSRFISNVAHINMIQAKPVFGWGVGNYNRYHMQFVERAGGVAVTDAHISSHNTFLSMTVELGLVGLFLYFAPWFSLLGKSVVAYKRFPREIFCGRYLLLGIWLGIFFWFVVALTTNFRVSSWSMTWIQFNLGLTAVLVDSSRTYSQ